MIPAVVLAAGGSTRMGRPKALLSIDGHETFLTRIVRTFQAEADDVVVVVGHEAAAVMASVAAQGLTPRFVTNPDYASGQLSSLLAGLRAIDRPGVGGMLLTLVDVPLVSAATVRAVIERHRATGAPVVRPVSGVRHGHPVLIDRRLFDAIRSADPETGLKPIVRRHASAEGELQIEDEGAFQDVDTPEDYSRLFERSDRRRE
jgi:CTP:molybdopterin cytidylyltransferase MocA